MIENRACSNDSMEARLERGEVVYFPVCPFSLPEGEERRFLLQQELGTRALKNISYNPRTGKTIGFRWQSADQATKLSGMLEKFSWTATEWLSRTLPRYATGWKLELVSFRPEEEATRKLQLKARNDLLHVDAFPNRPTNGQRILRLFANVNLTEPRIWVTAESFGELLNRYGHQVGLHPEQGSFHRLGRKIFELIFWNRPSRSVYDAFMLRFHDFLKANKEFQKSARTKAWTFAPGSAWLVITDTASHAVLRGRYALEHSYFLAPETMALPDTAPAAQLARAFGQPVLKCAA